MNPWLLAAIVFGGIALAVEAGKEKPAKNTTKPKGNMQPTTPVIAPPNDETEESIVIDSESAADDGGIE